MHQVRRREKNDREKEFFSYLPRRLSKLRFLALDMDKCELIRINYDHRTIRGKEFESNERKNCRLKF